MGVGRQRESGLGVGLSRRQGDTGVGGVLLDAVIPADGDGPAVVFLLRFRCRRAPWLQQADLHHIHHRYHQAGRTYTTSITDIIKQVGPVVTATCDSDLDDNEVLVVAIGHF